MCHLSAELIRVQVKFRATAHIPAGIIADTILIGAIEFRFEPREIILEYAHPAH